MKTEPPDKVTPGIDLYAEVAQETGVTRQVVKTLAYSWMYSPHGPRSMEKLKSELIAHIRFLQELKIHHHP